ncbi:stage II sporulation protein R [Garciella nitratireducens]|uniref:stage II sporulation protein R n=1 Tax=Garciella nitratireducens TaxID=218205 RepID=UPI000E036689|nr:stage II sporulation protein R [Garciella nitratireducens]RBP39874.1 stage II sporulation protein R [Garciella nitratireducens]
MSIKEKTPIKKKSVIVIITIFLIGIIFCWQWNSAKKIQANVIRVEDLKEKSKIESQQQLANELVRFHVIANSDSDKDQAIKLKVRDAVLEEIVPDLKKSQSIEQTKEMIQSKTPDLIEVAQEVLKQNGVDYGVKAALGEHVFPTKYYGDFSLPAGEYQAFRIVLGDGSGANWWCVMFPPLCFVNADEEKSNVSQDSLAEEQKEQKNVSQKKQEKAEQKEKDQEQEVEKTDKIEDLIETASNKEESLKQEEKNELEEKKENIGEKIIIEESQPEETIQIKWKFLEVLQAIFHKHQ